MGYSNGPGISLECPACFLIRLSELSRCQSRALKITLPNRFSEPTVIFLKPSLPAQVFDDFRVLFHTSDRHAHRSTLTIAPFDRFKYFQVPETIEIQSEVAFALRFSSSIRPLKIREGDEGKHCMAINSQKQIFERTLSMRERLNKCFNLGYARIFDNFDLFRMLELGTFCEVSFARNRLEFRSHPM